MPKCFLSCFLPKQHPPKKEFDKNVRILFVLKYREPDALWLPEDEQYSYSTGQLSSGLANSAGFANNFLVENGVESKLVHVIDNNYIDKEVTAYKPTHVIIEAYWVVPEKFEVLTKLHPNVKWIIRNHSHTPFLANEGIAFDWSMKYLENKNVYLSCNHKVALQDMRWLTHSTYPSWSQEKIKEKVLYHPNVYALENRPSKWPTHDHESLRVSSFGAIRPLKNQVSQAIAALEYARRKGKFLEFHINGTRKEGNGAPILKNIRSIFSHAKNAKLIEHSWLDHQSFLDLVDTMDIGLQVTYTETFNIVAADMVSGGIPIVTSAEIPWVSDWCKADPNNVADIIRKMEHVLNPRFADDIRYENIENLTRTVKAHGEFWKTWP